MNLLDFNRIKQITTATQRQESEFFKKNSYNYFLNIIKLIILIINYY